MLHLEDVGPVQLAVGRAPALVTRQVYLHPTCPPKLHAPLARVVRVTRGHHRGHVGQDRGQPDDRARGGGHEHEPRVHGGDDEADDDHHEDVDDAHLLFLLSVALLKLLNFF